ncbi:unnamed protein product [Effrenium voratum]|nr:unnamed protein product [Effrenium voratum]
MNQLTQGRTCVSARLVQGLNAECVDTALAAMEGDFGARLQLLEAQVGDLQRRVETVSGEAPAGDVLKRLQTVEETISQSSEDKLQGMSAELQASVKAVLQKLEKGLSTLEEATKQQTKQTESTLTRLAKKVEETLQNSALEIGDAALQSLLDQAEKMPRVRPFPADRGVVRQVSHDWQARLALALALHGAAHVTGGVDDLAEASTLGAAAGTGTREPASHVARGHDCHGHAKPAGARSFPGPQRGAGHANGASGWLRAACYDPRAAIRSDVSSNGAQGSTAGTDIATGPRVAAAAPSSIAAGDAKSLQAA